MNKISRIKIIILRTLLQTAPLPLSAASLDSTVRLAEGEVLVSDFKLALRQLEGGNLISGNENALTNVISWTLTDQGTHEAKKL